MSKKLEDITTCGICLDTFNKPKMFPCQHSFCFECLPSMISKDKRSIKCSLCQRDHAMPASGIAGFVDNLLLNNLIDVQKSEVCVDCKQNTSSDHECEHCRQKLCSRCLVEHTKLVMELSFSFNQVKENLMMPVTQDEKKRMMNFRVELERERTKMNSFLQARAVRRIEQATVNLKRASSMDNLMRILGGFYEMLGGDDANAKSETYLSEVLKKPNECTSIDSLKELKNKVSDLKNLLKLIQTKDEKFKFRYGAKRGTVPGLLEFGKAVVNIEGHYDSINVADRIGRLAQDCEELEDTFQQRAGSPDPAVPGPSRVLTGAEEKRAEPQIKKRKFTADQDEPAPVALGLTRDGTNPLAFMRGYPKVIGLQRMARKDPGIVPALVEHSAQQFPLIRENRAAFAELLKEPAIDSDGGDGQQTT